MVQTDSDITEERLNTIWQGNFFLICGPCVIEDEIQGENFTYQIASELKTITEELKIPFIFKASFDKANRTSHKSFRGPGLHKGLNILQKIKDKLDLLMITDVHRVEQVEPASKVSHILQIPAFLCRQTDLLEEVARKARAINIKKGQFLAPWDMEHAIGKVESLNQKKILITERGTSFGYNNLVSDMRSIPLMKKFGYPIVFDGTHSVQLPGGQGESTGGTPEMIEPLCRASVGAGCDGLFLEVHPNPAEALSDGSNALPIHKIKNMMETLLEIHHIVNPNK